MRIISGEFKRRRLVTPGDAETTRPIPDLVKGAVFNLLRGHCEGAVVFDGFAGTGAIGLEAVSRGAVKLVAVEKDRKIAGILRRNIEHLGVEDRVELLNADALSPVTAGRCPEGVNLVFLDPPYPMIRERAGWDRVRAQMGRLIARMADDGFLVVRTPWPHVFEEARETGGGPEVVEIDLESEDADEALDAFEASLTGAGAKTYVDAEMGVEGAVGPETHVYRNTAVHLYMRDLPGNVVS